MNLSNKHMNPIVTPPNDGFGAGLTGIWTKKLIATAIAVCLLPAFSSAQFLIDWQVTLGGTNYEECTVLRITDDGGCVVGGGSDSDPSGNKTAASHALADYWLVKLDADGNKEWDRTYGGSGVEYPNGLQIAPDGGFVLGGHTRSDADGNKTSSNFGGRDFWLVKTDASGNKQWDVEFGGSANDSAWCLTSAANGYLLSGATFSDVSGNKTSASIGQDDWWVVKVNTVGVKQWEMAYGGVDNDYLYCAEPAGDGEFFLAGESESGTSGNKTESNIGLYDGWVLKIDSDGNKIWERALGGMGQDFLTFIHPTADGGCFVGGSSQSGADGNKASPNYGNNDWWLIKLNADGTKQWDKSYGGDGDDFLKGMLPYRDGFLLFGTSWSDVSGNKTAPKYGESDFWLVMVDASGNVQWEQVLGGFDTDYAVEAFQATPDGGFLLGGYSASAASGNKTVASNGDFDYWVVKLVTAPTLAIDPAGAGQVMISWSPDAPGFLLQETEDFNPTDWKTSASGAANPTTVPSSGPNKFYRLISP
jgi:hypothetical protein